MPSTDDDRRRVVTCQSTKGAIVEKEGSKDMEVRQQLRPAEPAVVEPEALPLSLAGKWVAWSSDGMRILAASESSEEAERLAIATGEPEPILERHSGRYRL